MEKLNPTFRAMIVLFALLVAWSFLAPSVADRLITEKPLDHADVILVLAGSSTYLERTQKAAQLFRKNISPKVLLTDDGGQAGWSQEDQRNPLFVELARKQLIANGVPSVAIETLSPEVSSTFMEASLLSKKAVERRWKSLLIVTSPYHTHRALRTFQIVFARIDVGTEIGIVSPKPGQQSPPTWYWWVTRHGWQQVAGEYVKSIYYHVNYY